MAEDNDSSADPSMEEILASIRKIISDDTPPPAQDAAPEPQPEPEPIPEPVPEPQPEPEPTPPEEVLELTQLIQDDGSIKDLAAEPAPVVATEPLVSEPAAETAASVFSSLANTVDIERMATGANKPTFIGNGARTLEDMALELMRPLLREWLDHNLPALVERLVQKEIDRISHR